MTQKSTKAQQLPPHDKVHLTFDANSRWDGTRVTFGYWTRWPRVAGAARHVIDGCIRFAHQAQGGAPPARILLVKTPGRGIRLPQDLLDEEEEWHQAMEAAKSRYAGHGTEFEFVYLAANPPVTAAWLVTFALSRFWESSEILAFPTMDSVDAMIADPKYQLTRLDRLEEPIRTSVLDAPKYFREMLEQVKLSRGLAIGGYQTKELSNEADEDRLWERRGRQSAKDLIEHAIRGYASGMFKDHHAFQALLRAEPQLRVRSEILALHSDFWLKLMANDMLRLEPWEATIQLILSALDLGFEVRQVDFHWLIEEGRKTDFVITEQLRRGIHCVDRLAASRRAATETATPTSAASSLQS